MSNDHIISWHPDAVLFDRDGKSTSAIGQPMADCDPTNPLTALPAYIAAITTGDMPIMGRFQGKRPKCIGDFLTQTGGSTGAPKTIWRSSESWILSFHQMAQNFGIHTTSEVAVLGHLNHSLALYAGLEALHLGANFHALGGLKPYEYAKTLHQRRITHLYATPTQLRLMPTTVIPNIQTVLVGGGMLDATTKDHITSIFLNAEIIEFYGAAETSFITLSNPQTPVGSVGRSFPDVTIDIRKADNTHCDVNEIGQVWVKSPLAYKGYLPGTKHNQEYIHVGEMGHMDKDGYLFLSGRSDRAVTIADQTVYLDQLEAMIAQSHTLQNIAIIAAKNTLRGYTLHAITQSKEITLTDLTANLSRYVQPRTLTYVPDWPLLPSGKTDYKILERHIKGNVDD